MHDVVGVEMWWGGESIDVCFEGEVSPGVLSSLLLMGMTEELSKLGGGDSRGNEWKGKRHKSSLTQLLCVF